MVDKRSKDYLKSEVSSGLYRNEKSTTYEKEVKVDGKDTYQVKMVARDLE